MLLRARNAVLLLLVSLSVPTLAWANPAARLAPPGPCAEPRGSAVGIVAPSDFSVVGPAGSLLSPVDVAGAPQPAVLPPPTRSRVARPGACEGPGTSCGLNQPDRRVAVAPPAAGGGGRSPRGPAVPVPGGGARGGPGVPQ